MRERILLTQKLWWIVLAAIWVAGIVAIVLGHESIGYAANGLGAAGMLGLYWLRGGGQWLPDGGGPL